MKNISNSFVEKTLLAYSLLLICNRVVTNKHVLDIPPVVVSLDRVLTKVTIVVTNRTVFFQKCPSWFYFLLY